MTFASVSVEIFFFIIIMPFSVTYCMTIHIFCIVLKVVHEKSPYIITVASQCLLLSSKQHSMVREILWNEMDATLQRAKLRAES